MSKLVVAVAFLLAAVPASAQVGVFTVAGTNDGGKTYEGIIQITETDGVYALEWELTAGDTAVGYGFLDGETLAFICQAQSPSGAVGLAYGFYRLEAGKWKGKWSSPGLPAPGSEVLTPTTKTLEQLRRDLKAKKSAAQA